MQSTDFRDIIEKLASEKIEGKQLKEIYSYKGFSFWWLLKHMVLESKINQPEGLKAFYELKVVYWLRLLKDIKLGFISRIFKKIEQKPLLIFSLIRLRNRYFKLIEDGLKNAGIEYNYVAYFPIIPKIHDLKQPSSKLEVYISMNSISEELKLRSNFSKYSGPLATFLEQKLSIPSKSAKFIADLFLTVEIPEQFRILKSAGLMLDELKPKAVLLTQEDGLHSYAVIAEAKKREIKTISIEHGVPVAVPQNLEENIPVSKNDFINFLRPDNFLVYSRRDEEIYKKYFLYQNITITGQPRYDELYKNINMKKELRKKLSLPENKIIVLWTSQVNRPPGSLEDDRNHAKIIFESMNSLRQDYQLIIKLHHGEDQSAPLHKEFNRKYGNLAIIYDAKTHLFDLLIASDIILNATSTAGLEGILAGKPLIQLDSRFKGSNKIYLDMGFDIVVNNSSQLTSEIKQALTPKGLSKFMKIRDQMLSESYTNFGKSVSETIKIVSSIIK